MSNAITVWREFHGDVEPVGLLSSHGGEIRFAYNSEYRGAPISFSLPVQKDPFPAHETSIFFSALLPEGAARRELARIFRAERDDFVTYLEQLNDESIGALLFSVGDREPYADPHYEPIEARFFEEFGDHSLDMAVTTTQRTRLSLSGAMAKVGLYRDEESGAWFYPLGAAPSTHIVKAANSARFPLETLNEALCLGVARRCDFPASECELIPIETGEPLIAIRRFDRVFDDVPRIVDGHPAPRRLHQEDLSQASVTPLKYEPTDGNYLSLITSVTRRACANSFGEASLVVEYTMFDYLVGNCDNHLKNYSLLYDAEWKTREAAPLYDVVSTVAYPEIYKEMGVSFGGSRRIDEVTPALIEGSLQRSGIPVRMAISNFRNLAKQLPEAVEEEADKLEKDGFPQVRKLIKPLLDGIAERSRVLGI